MCPNHEWYEDEHKWIREKLHDTKRIESFQVENVVGIKFEKLRTPMPPSKSTLFTPGVKFEPGMLVY